MLVRGRMPTFDITIICGFIGLPHVAALDLVLTSRQPIREFASLIIVFGSIIL